MTTEFLVSVTLETGAFIDTTFKLSLYVDGVEVGNGAYALWYTAGSNSPCFEYIIALKNSQVLSLWVESIASTRLDIYSAQFCITAIGAAGAAGTAGATGPAGTPAYYAEMSQVSATFSPVHGSSPFVILPYVTLGPVSVGPSPPNPAASLANGTITIEADGTYAVDVSMSYASPAATSYRVGIYVNSLISQLVVYSVTSTGEVYYEPSISGILTLSRGDVLDVRFTNLGANESGLTFSSMIFSVYSLGAVGPTGPAGGGGYGAQPITVPTIVSANNQMAEVTVNATAIVTIGTGVTQITVKDETGNPVPTIPITSQAGLLLEDPNNLGTPTLTTVVLKQPAGAVTFRLNAAGTAYRVIAST